MVYSNSGNRIINVFKTLEQSSSYLPYEYENRSMILITKSALNFYLF